MPYFQFQNDTLSTLIVCKVIRQGLLRCLESSRVYTLLHCIAFLNVLSRIPSCALNALPYSLVLPLYQPNTLPFFVLLA